MAPAADIHIIKLFTSGIISKIKILWENPHGFRVLFKGVILGLGRAFHAASLPDTTRKLNKKKRKDFDSFVDLKHSDKSGILHVFWKINIDEANGGWNKK